MKAENESGVYALIKCCEPGCPTIVVATVTGALAADVMSRDYHSAALSPALYSGAALFARCDSEGVSRSSSSSCYDGGITMSKAGMMSIIIIMRSFVMYHAWCIKYHVS